MGVRMQGLHRSAEQSIPSYRLRRACRLCTQQQKRASKTTTTATVVCRNDLALLRIASDASPLPLPIATEIPQVDSYAFAHGDEPSTEETQQGFVHVGGSMQRCFANPCMSF